MGKLRTRRYRQPVEYPKSQTCAIRNWVFRSVANLMEVDKRKPMVFR